MEADNQYGIKNVIGSWLYLFRHARLLICLLLILCVADCL